MFYKGKFFLKTIEPKTLNSNGSFQTWCRFKFIKIIYLNDVLRPQRGME
jgi:hypothetical protein